ncbi:universal stress protein [Terrabacter sp. Root181]|jgi:nucleotide-binding universal stress UspA family protein|uniref:universal stress protein n=1 Tax=Terrabacter sp. Root181 TaxID=1736484 RepID=UPI0006F1F776|nr:universal stress protein [Terrabacter sp. Root181]KRB43100.1 universal stress protein UspA [Terrabacter sp. Root181]
MPIVVGYIPSPAGHAALTTAIAEARLRGSRLVVVNASRGDALVDRRHSSAEDWQSVRDQLGESGVEHEVLQQVEAKDPADQILEVAQQTNAELIVVGLRRRTPVGKLIMGSQAQQILLDADCPVLAVKADPS